MLLQGILHIGLRLGALFNLQMNRLCVSLNLLNALDDLVFKYFLAALQIRHLFVRCSVSTRSRLQVRLASLAQHEQLSLQILIVFFLQIRQVVVRTLPALHTCALLTVKVQI